MPTTLNEAQRLLEEKMIETVKLLESKFNKVMCIPRLKLEKLGLRGGFATKSEHMVVINSAMITEARWQYVLNQVLPHEVCHLYAIVMYDRWRHGRDIGAGWGHGRAWKQCMLAVGLQPDRCMELSAEEKDDLILRRVERKYAYTCKCPNKTHFLTAIKHNRFQKGRYRRLHCLTCKASVVYAGEKIKS